MLGLQSCGRSDSRSDYTLSNTYVFSKIHVGHRNCVQVGVCSLAANMRQQCASSANSNAQCTWTWEKAKKLPDRARQIVFWDDDSQLLVCRETHTEGDTRSRKNYQGVVIFCSTRPANSKKDRDEKAREYVSGKTGSNTTSYLLSAFWSWLQQWTETVGRSSCAITANGLCLSTQTLQGIFCDAN